MFLSLEGVWPALSNSKNESTSSWQRTQAGETGESVDSASASSSSCLGLHLICPGHPKAASKAVPFSCFKVLGSLRIIVFRIISSVL
jgi:hypothetical protein